MKTNFAVAVCFLMMLSQLTAEAEVQGRYVRFGAALSPTLSLAEVEVWSGGKNVIAGQPQSISQDHYFTLYRGSIPDLVDGRKDTSSRSVELTTPGASQYQDVSEYYSCIEIDLGESMPIDKVDIYRARYKFVRPHWIHWDDFFWRYLVVLDENRNVVAAEAFHVFEPPYPENEGHWSFAVKPAEEPLAGRHVPTGSRSWLSEAEFIRDFLGRPVVDLNATITDDDQKRLDRYNRRNNPEQIAALGREFFSVIDLDRPGYEKVKALVEQEAYAEALEAFKEPFFASIDGLADQTLFEYSWSYEPDTRNVMRARDLANHIIADRDEMKVNRFVPGLMPLEQFRYPFRLRPALLSYVATKDASYLRAWEALTDDWALAFQAEADKDPKRLRDHFVLIGGPILANLADLANANRSSPGFSKDVSGATLARYLLPILEEMPVSVWRVTRKTVLNHTYNATSESVGLGATLSDFRAGQRLHKEMRQGVQRLHTLTQYRDGPMVEGSDEGHFLVAFDALSRLYGRLSVERPDWFTPAVEAYFLRNLRQAELAVVRHAAPSGIGIRWDASVTNTLPTFKTRWEGELSAYNRGEASKDRTIGALQRLSVLMEPEPRAVAETVYGRGWHGKAVRERFGEPSGDRPSFRSDFLPYAGMYNFRGGWDRTDSFLHMIKPAISNNLKMGMSNRFYRGWEQFTTTTWRLQDYGTPLVSMFGTQIDGQMPSPEHGRYPSGSKQEIFTQAVEKPQPRRWHTDDQLDFGEAVYNGVYNNVYRNGPDNGSPALTFETDPLIIRDATATRQIFHIRPARLFLQSERIKYASSDETHQNRSRVTLILTEPDPESGQSFSNDQMKLDEDGKQIIVRNPGNAGLTLGWFGQEDLSFKQYTINGTLYGFYPRAPVEKVDPEADAKFPGKVETPYGTRRTTGRGIYAGWSAEGEGVILAAVRAQMADEEPIKSMTDISTDEAAGARIEMANGTVVTLLTARQIPATLRIDGVRTRGEALLLVQQQDAPAYGIALGARATTINNNAISGTPSDFRFTLARGDRPAITPIHRPLDPPTIEPGINTFTNSTTVTLSTDSPDSEIRYTTQPPTSRMDEFSAAADEVLAGRTTMQEAARGLTVKQEPGLEWQVYTGPFEITEDTLVRARTFRKGVTQISAMLKSGVDVSEISFGFFDKQEPKPAIDDVPGELEPGLSYDYLEDRWFALWTYTDILPAAKSGTVSELLDVSMREADGPFAVRYRGYLDVPADGIYTFYPPNEFINNICAPGYDLRLYIDNQEWDLVQTWHGRGTWSVALKQGLHEFMVTFADARARDIDNQRLDLWNIGGPSGAYPQPATTWRGVAPTLEVAGPGFGRQTIPSGWLKRAQSSEQ